MYFKAICLATALIAVAASPAGATPASVPFVGFISTNDDSYGFVLNTDGGTFDGVALAEAVQASEDVAPSSIGISLSAARAGRTER